MASQYAVIVANPNSSEIGDIVSQHRSREAAERSMSKLDGLRHRWAYVATRRADGSWQHRSEVV